ncbi:MAG: rRNA pseudouridine synthase [Phycisphaeraceae bacterium]|nr:rRNA pseudouridine synthase [Phycisphaeraceae bacterium]
MPHDYTDNTRGIRLQKAMAESGLASRRTCEELIEAGRVTVNGTQIKELPAWVDPAQDAIKVDGEALPRTPRSRRGKEDTAIGKTYVIVNKPRGVITTNDDPEGRRRVIDLVDDNHLSRKRLFPVGRLDADSTGMILLTDDGELTHRLTHPSFEAPKEYRVTVGGTVSVEALEKLRKGIYLASPKEIGKSKSAEPPEGSAPRKKSAAKKAAPDAVRILRVEKDRGSGDRTMLAMTLHEGQNREIRRVLARLDLKVKKLKRVAIGPIQMKTLRSGSWRELSGPEVRKLRKSVGLK